MKGPLFTLGNRIYFKTKFSIRPSPNIIIMTGPPILNGQDSNPGIQILSLEADGCEQVQIY